MELNKKRFPIKLEIKEAIKLIDNNLKNKGHNLSIKPKDVYITIAPYWFCFYNINSNINGKYKFISKQIALNAVTNIIDEKVIELFNYAKPSIIDKLNIPKTEKTQIKIKKEIINKDESKLTFLNYLSSKYNVDKKNISLSGIEEICVPKWKYKSKIGKLKLDGVCGKINNFEIIKENKQTNYELLKEMFNDLKSPNKILEYMSFFFVNLFKGIYWLIKKILKNIKIILFIILAVLFIYLIYYYI